MVLGEEVQNEVTSFLNSPQRSILNSLAKYGQLLVTGSVLTQPTVSKLFFVHILCLHMSLVVPCNWLYHACLQMSDTSVSCKVGARYLTLVVFANLFYIVFNAMIFFRKVLVQSN